MRNEPITEIRKSSQAGAEERFQRLSVFACERKVILEVLFDLLSRTSLKMVDV